VTVTNTGKRAGEETVQWYIRDVVGSSTRPVKQLKGFQKIMLQPGEAKTLSMDIDESMLAFYNNELVLRAEPGQFEAMVGPNSAQVRRIAFVFE
jgi:beta-glucosidase